MHCPALSRPRELLIVSTSHRSLLKLLLHAAVWGLLAVPLFANKAAGIPLFARKYDVTCGRCHVSVPRLNEFGVAFLERGYQMPANWSSSERRTIPLALWVSGRHDSRPRGAVPDYVSTYFNRIEAISGGKIVVDWLSYFVEWRPLSREQRGNGTIRDRSGRFEDLFVTASTGHVDLTAGQFRQVMQVDVSRRLGISEPLVLASGLAGSGSGPSRLIGLRSFSPSGRSPSIRLGLTRKSVGGLDWSAAAALPVPGEFSIPLTDSARVEASNEIEWRRKGFFGETFVRKGFASAGLHTFYDNSDRYLVNIVTTGRLRDLYWTGMGGVDKLSGINRGRWSVEGEYIPHLFFGVGGRAENRAGDGAPMAFLPYLNVNFPSTKFTLRFTAERRIQAQRGATLLELGTIF